MAEKREGYPFFTLPTTPFPPTEREGEFVDDPIDADADAEVQERFQPVEQSRCSPGVKGAITGF